MVKFHPSSFNVPAWLELTPTCGIIKASCKDDNTIRLTFFKDNKLYDTITHHIGTAPTRLQRFEWVDSSDTVFITVGSLSLAFDKRYQRLKTIGEGRIY
jgi:hypothetical protein